MTNSPAPQTAGVTEKWLSCNGRQLRKLFRAGLLWLEQNHTTVNALNVFPVPDGDTGTNMLLTMRAAYRRIENSDEMHAGRMAQELAHGALMGARGNSGVILSQIWRGFARSLTDKEVATAADIAAALKEAAETAYKGVMRPVEGTILTVVREGSEEAQDALSKSADLRFLLERVLERSQQTLERTPEMLDALKQAGVVDSGGQGFVYILEGMLRYVNGDLIKETAQPQPAVAPPSAPHAGQAHAPTHDHLPAQALAAPDGGALEFPYDVQFILTGQSLDVSAVRDAIDAMGDSTLVVGDERVIKVHVHVADPGQPLSYAVTVGSVSDVVVENMQEQMEAIIAHPPAVNHQHLSSAPSSGLGVVAVAAGPGLSDIFRSLGAAAIVNGGQGHNPSTEEIVHAIEEAPNQRILVLPNNKNVILAAEAACELTTKEVRVVPTRTAPQGISAMLALNPDGDLHEVREMMVRAGKQVASAEITLASRTVTMDGVDVTEGEMIGLVDGHICASGATLQEVLVDTLDRMSVADRELLSVYYGEDVQPAEAEQLSQQIEALYPHLEIELLPGGQPYYMYILGAE